MKVILSVFALFSIAFLLPSSAFGELTVVQTESKVKVDQQNWYDDSWEFRKKITMSLNTATGVDSDLYDFPVLIKFTDDDLKQANESMGRDFVFTESDGITKLSHEIEHYDENTEFNDTVILFLYSHSVSYHAPNASEGRKNTIENNTKTDKITFNSIRSDLRF